MTNEELRETISNTVRDSARNFCFYDRKEDEGLSRNALSNAVAHGLITTDELGVLFAQECRSWGGLVDKPPSETVDRPPCYPTGRGQCQEQTHEARNQTPESGGDEG